MANETMERLYLEARDENELLEFKNYELQFKVQELEQKLQEIASKILIVEDFKQQQTTTRRHDLQVKNNKKLISKEELEDVGRKPAPQIKMSERHGAAQYEICESILTESSLGDDDSCSRPSSESLSTSMAGKSSAPSSIHWLVESTPPTDRRDSTTTQMLEDSSLPSSNHVVELEGDMPAPKSQERARIAVPVTRPQNLLSKRSKSSLSLTSNSKKRPITINNHKIAPTSTKIDTRQPNYASNQNNSSRQANQTKNPSQIKYNETVGKTADSTALARRLLSRSCSQLVAGANPTGTQPSCSSKGHFVTQIPTLISQSHGIRRPLLNERIITRTSLSSTPPRPRTGAAQSSQFINGSSTGDNWSQRLECAKSCSNLTSIASLSHNNSAKRQHPKQHQQSHTSTTTEARADDDHESDELQVAAAREGLTAVACKERLDGNNGDANANPNANEEKMDTFDVKLEDSHSNSDPGQETQLVASISSSHRIDESPSHSCSSFENPAMNPSGEESTMNGGQQETKSEAATPAKVDHNLTHEAQEHSQQDTGKSLDTPTKKPHLLLLEERDRDLAIDEPTTCSSILETKLSGTQIGAESSNGDENFKCENCAKLELHLDQLRNEKRALSEQLNELEEQENDSRLQSQRLGKKLTACELQLEGYRTELERLNGCECQLQAQNKRLTFELSERSERLKELQVQLNRVQQRLLRAEEEQRGQARQRAKLESASESSSARSETLGPASKSQKAANQRDNQSDQGDDQDEASSTAAAGREQQPGEGDSAYSKSSSSSSDSQSEDGRDLAEELLHSPAHSGRDAKTLEHNSGPEAIKSNSTSGQLLDMDDCDCQSSESMGSSGASSNPSSTESGAPSKQPDPRAPIVSAQQKDQPEESANKRQIEDDKPTSSNNRELGSPKPGTKALELALEGVKELERASCYVNEAHAPVALRALLLEPATRAAQVTKAEITNQNNEQQSAGSKKQLDRSELEAAQLRHELTILKGRLNEAQMLNDNLVNELRARKSQQPVASIEERLQQRHSIAVTSSRLSNQTAAQRSYIYITSNSHPMNQEPIDQKKEETKHLNDVISSSSGSDSNNCHSWPSDYVQFLIMLLEKLHSQHGQSYELLRESERVAMSILKSSHNQQLCWRHHNSVVAAGWAAANKQLPGSMETRPVDDANPIDIIPESLAAAYPVLPPPRRRSNNNATQTSHYNQIHAPHGTTKSCPGEGGGVALTGNRTHAIAANTNQQQAISSTSQPNRKLSMSQTALQVAKQTLLSIVPIHYSNCGQQQREIAATSHSNNHYDSHKQTNGALDSIALTSNGHSQRLWTSAGSKSSNKSPVSSTLNAESDLLSSLGTSNNDYNNSSMFSSCFSEQTGDSISRNKQQAVSMINSINASLQVQSRDSRRTTSSSTNSSSQSMMSLLHNERYITTRQQPAEQTTISPEKQQQQQQQATITLNNNTLLQRLNNNNNKDHHHHHHQQQQQTTARPINNNVSVLQINQHHYSTSTTSCNNNNNNLDDFNSPYQHLYQESPRSRAVRSNSNSYSSSSSCYANFVVPENNKNSPNSGHEYNNLNHGQQQLPATSDECDEVTARINNSTFKEEIERYQARFNALLLDLLNRQNWYEQLIAQKIKSIQGTLKHPHPHPHNKQSSTMIINQPTIITQSDPSHSLPNLRVSTQSTQTAVPSCESNSLTTMIRPSQSNSTSLLITSSSSSLSSKQQQQLINPIEQQVKVRHLETSICATSPTQNHQQNLNYIQVNNQHNNNHYHHHQYQYQQQQQQQQHNSRHHRRPSSSAPMSTFSAPSLT